MAKQLSYNPLLDIGINGLNTQTNPASLEAAWLVKAENIVIKESGRLSIRKGLQQKIIPNATNSITSIVEHNDQGTNKIFASHGGSIYTVDFTSPNAAFPSSGVDVKHTVSGTTGNWQFINFNNRLHCLHAGAVPQRYDGSAASNEKWSNTYTTNAINLANGSEITDTEHVSNGILKDKSYQITALGTPPTPFDLVGGATDNAVGEIFTATHAGADGQSELIAMNKMITGTVYKIINLGDSASSLTASGADNSPAVDEIFTANAILGTGTGLVREVLNTTNGKVVEIKTNPTLTTITIDSTSGFPTTGQIIIDDEIVTYTGKTNTSFTGCIRGAKGTTATHHLDNAVVTNNTAPPSVTSGEFKPTCGVGFYGRLWLGGVAEEKDILHYSALLDGDDFTLRSGGGAFDLKSVWGRDDIIAIAPFYGQLAVFGKNNIAIYDRPDSVSDMQLNEVIRGIGCIARDSIQAIGDDLVFLSSTGLRSLARTTEKDKVPLTDLSVNIKDRLIRNLEQSKEIKSAYIENEGVYILFFTDSNLTYIFDFKYLTPNAAPRITTWTFAKERHPTSIAYTELHGMLVGQEDGGIAEYKGYFDTTASFVSNAVVQSFSSYTMNFETVWLNLGETVQASLLKKLFMVLEGGAGSTLFLKWYKDFLQAPFKTTQIKLNPRTLGNNSLYGIKSIINTVQPASTLYGSQPVVTLTVGSLVVNSYYAISNLGNTSQSQWNTVAGTTSSPVTYSVGDVIKVSVNSQNIGNGQVVSHVHVSANHTHSYTYAPIYGLKEYRTPLIGSAKYLKISIAIISNGYSTSLQNMTLLHKQGKIR
tara:strand:+ start:712 stop:3165 length:2454 start_codon:yes stop_codon:yes gene_type:complete